MPGSLMVWRFVSAGLFAGLIDVIRNEMRIRRMRRHVVAGDIVIDRLNAWIVSDGIRGCAMGLVGDGRRGGQDGQHC